jgi:lambda repressor-like predicted transcriptional regulator
MDYLDLKFALARKGYTLTRVAAELGLFGPQSVQQVLTRKYISARVEKRVSEITGIPLEKLFPDRYHPAKHRTRANGENVLEKTRDTRRVS